jgi:hypothetical protein
MGKKKKTVKIKANSLVPGIYFSKRAVKVRDSSVKCGKFRPLPPSSLHAAKSFISRGRRGYVTERKKSALPEHDGLQVAHDTKCPIDTGPYLAPFQKSEKSESEALEQVTITKSAPPKNKPNRRRKERDFDVVDKSIKFYQKYDKNRGKKWESLCETNWGRVEGSCLIFPRNRLVSTYNSNYKCAVLRIELRQSLHQEVERRKNIIIYFNATGNFTLGQIQDASRSILMDNDEQTEYSPVAKYIHRHENKKSHELMIGVLVFNVNLTESHSYSFRYGSSNGYGHAYTSVPLFQYSVQKQRANYGVDKEPFEDRKGGERASDVSSNLNSGQWKMVRSISKGVSKKNGVSKIWHRPIQVPKISTQAIVSRIHREEKALKSRIPETRSRKRMCTPNDEGRGKERMGGRIALGLGGIKVISPLRFDDLTEEKFNHDKNFSKPSERDCACTNGDERPLGPEAEPSLYIITTLPKTQIQINKRTNEQTSATYGPGTHLKYRVVRQPSVRKKESKIMPERCVTAKNDFPIRKFNSKIAKGVEKIRPKYLKHRKLVSQMESGGTTKVTLKKPGGYSWTAAAEHYSRDEYQRELGRQIKLQMQSSKIRQGVMNQLYDIDREVAVEELTKRLFEFDK